MKVSQIMSRSLITVSEDTPASEVGRLIFTLGVAGVPVVRGKKLVGIITEKDILGKLLPTIKDLIEDYAHASNFELMEKNLANVFSAPARRIMNKSFLALPPETPLMRAQALMLAKKISRIPVTDKDNNLIGIVTQGDIFKQLLREQMPKLESERYASFIANYYDLMVKWEKRFEYEFPPLFSLFKKEGVKTILDVGVWTGEYAIGLAKRWPHKILGLDHSPAMINMCEKKREKLPTNIKENLNFLLTDFSDLPQKITDKFDAALCMGNSLPYLPVTPLNLFKDTFEVLQKNGLLILQVLNFEKVLITKSRLLSFIIQKSNSGQEKEHLFIEFFDGGKDDFLLHHVIIFDSDGKNWVFKGIISIPIRLLNEWGLKKSLKAAGFKSISTSGNMGEYEGEYGPLSFETPFDTLKSDWLIILAKKS